MLFRANPALPSSCHARRPSGTIRRALLDSHRGSRFPSLFLVVATGRAEGRAGGGKTLPSVRPRFAGIVRSRRGGTLACEVPALGPPVVLDGRAPR